MNDVHELLYSVVNRYENIPLANGQIVHTPYWMNKLEGGFVKLRGQYNGKGTWQNIQDALNVAIKEEGKQAEILSDEEVEKLAKRHRIGIDCSGYVFRILEAVYSEKNSIMNRFHHGINGTNANMITSDENTEKVGAVIDIKPLDVVRMHAGKHLLLVLKNDGKAIEYTHSSEYTEKKGVHKGRIYIKDKNKGLEYQEWEEKAKSGNNYGKEYFDPKKGDGARRFK